MKPKWLMMIAIILLLTTLNIPTSGAEKLFKIAVLPFDDGSIKEHWWNEKWKLGKGVTDELVTALLGTKKFRLIEREQIDSIIQEQDLGTGGRVDPQTAAKIKKILGVQYLVIGRITEFSMKTENLVLAAPSKKGGVGLAVSTTTSRVVMDARLVDTTTAEIIVSLAGKGEKVNSNVDVIVDSNAMAFGSNEFQKTDLGIALRNAVTQVAAGLAASAYETVDTGPTVLTGTVFYAKSNKVIINIGSDDEVQVGMVFIVNRVLEQIKDPDTGEIVDEITEPVAEITVTEVKEKTATGIVTTTLNKKYSINVKDKIQQKI